jgi:hypothetical protein
MMIPPPKIEAESRPLLLGAGLSFRFPAILAAHCFRYFGCFFPEFKREAGAQVVVANPALPPQR